MNPRCPLITHKIFDRTTTKDEECVVFDKDTYPKLPHTESRRALGSIGRRRAQQLKPEAISASLRSIPASHFQPTSRSHCRPATRQRPP
ncbi:hypothetical protein PF005_g12223 [Phytophthora fragariae]|uniref:Uncharacterized protein n=1 Tax=Phytophthora fragariae TaxID=53985 RepID=A0A6A3XU91_9STRA|nr:hypothetical protein PF005_g12223 [Phytophthora fragariae]KAE9241638.1 hypothetical protein PF004_g6959 [Phytophthora fragariae]KAE9348534.1 hypothetical protein PF008_g7296 [Phytophthora fragariae]